MESQAANLYLSRTIRSPIPNSKYNAAKGIADADCDGECVAMRHAQAICYTKQLIPSLFSKLSRNAPSKEEENNYGLKCVKDPVNFTIKIYLVDTIADKRFKFCVHYYADELELLSPPSGEQNMEKVNLVV